MKKKLKSLDMRIQVGFAVFGVLLVGVAGYMFVVSPQSAEATKIRLQVDNENSQIYHRRGELKLGQHLPTIETADLFRLARAMPDREDMPGIILTLSQVAQNAGIKFDLIEPVPNSAPPATGSYAVERIHLLFNGDFYGLSDFLYRLRSLVAVRNGNLEANGRLFNVDTLTFNLQGDTFPQISAELFVDAYVYGAPAAAAGTTAAAPTPTTTTTTPTTTTSSDSSLPPSGATAAGATP